MFFFVFFCVHDAVTREQYLALEQGLMILWVLYSVVGHDETCT